MHKMSFKIDKLTKNGALPRDPASGTNQCR